MNEIISGIGDAVCIGFLSVPKDACADPRNLVIFGWGMIATAFISLSCVLLIPAYPRRPKYENRAGLGQSRR
jgi:hypothetical protein